MRAHPRGRVEGTRASGRVKVAAFAAKAKTPGLSGVRCGGAAGRNAAPNTSREQRRSSFKSERMTETGPWGHALTKLAEWDPAWADACKAMSTNPWRTDVLSAKFVELVSLAINVACTNLDAEGTRRHIRGALEVRPSFSRRRRPRGSQRSRRRPSPRRPSTG